MDDILTRSLSGSVGGLVSLIVGLSCRRFRNDKYLRKALVEILGAALAGAFLPLSSLPLQIVVPFLTGLAWSQICQWRRDWLTQRVEQTVTSLGVWLKADRNPAETSEANRKLAVQWPPVLWGKALHGVGLSNLSDEQIAAYETYRAQVAWGAHFSRMPKKDGSYQRHWWITERAWPLITIIAAGTGAYAAAGIGAYFFGLTFALNFTPLVQALVILLLFLRIPDPLVDACKSPDETEAAMHFYRYWCAAQASWVFFYLIRFGMAMMPDRAWEIPNLFLDNLNSYFIFMCFFVLHDPPFLSSRDEPLSTRAPAIGMVVVVALTVAQTLCYLSGWERHIDYFYWICGCAGGVGLALLVGHLGSRFFDPMAPVWVIALLYFYVVIQGALGVPGLAEQLNQFSLFLALVLKFLLLLYVTWLLESDLLLSYMIHVRSYQD
jgi:hypothetical protein